MFNIDSTVADLLPFKMKFQTWNPCPYCASAIAAANNTPHPDYPSPDMTGDYTANNPPDATDQPPTGDDTAKNPPDATDQPPTGDDTAKNTPDTTDMTRRRLRWDGICMYDMGAPIMVNEATINLILCNPYRFSFTQTITTNHVVTVG
jgi:hypothetical protein